MNQTDLFLFSFFFYLFLFFYGDSSAGFDIGDKGSNGKRSVIFPKNKNWDVDISWTIKEDILISYIFVPLLRIPSASSLDFFPSPFL